MIELKCRKCSKIFDSPGFEERGGTMDWQWIDEALYAGWDCVGKITWTCPNCKKVLYAK